MATEFDILAQSHMGQQVREVGQLQVLLSALWQHTMDPADLDRSFLVFAAQADVLIKAARSRGELTAQQYYEATRTAAGYDVLDSASVREQPAERLANRAALHATSVARAKSLIAGGESPEAALALARVAMLNAAKRRVLDAPRKRLMTLSKSDPQAGRWSRVSDGKPCYFCAMLVSRGPVYFNAQFRAHDGCGCSVRPVFRNDPAGGWSDDALAMRELYEREGADGLAGSYDWRNTYNRAVADPTSSVSKALADRWQLAA